MGFPASEIFLVLTALIVWMIWIEPRLYQISRHDAILQKSLKKPLRILHLSDIHFNLPDPALARFFDRLAREPVDFVFVTGDIIDCDAGIPVCIENFKKLKSRYGTFAVFGNHDYYDYRFADVLLHNFPGQKFPKNLQNDALFEKCLKEIGIRILKNETVSLNMESESILIHGLDDATTGRANVRVAMQNFDPLRINFLLTHTIDVFLDIGENEIDVSFSGHSHGGQVCLPLVGPMITHTMIGRQYASGLKFLKGTMCYISRGMGESRNLPPRFLCRPEALIVTICGKN